MISRRLGVVEQHLPSSHFFRCHRTHMVNLRHVARLLRNGGYRAILVTGMVVEVSRGHWEALVDALRCF